MKYEYDNSVKHTCTCVLSQKTIIMCLSHVTCITVYLKLACTCTVCIKQMAT